MFTGLVAEQGRIESVSPRGSGKELWLRSTFAGLCLGESIACDGVCLTVEAYGPEGSGRFQVHVGEETLRRTTLGWRRPGDSLHLERALRLGDRLGGHWVQGHVDGVGEVRAVVPGAEWTRVDIAVPTGLGRYVVAKGSICVDGVSLTVNDVRDATFSVGIVPHTSGLTRMASLRPGDQVNLEVDILAKYVERLLGLEGTGGLTLERLRAAGFATE